MSIYKSDFLNEISSRGFIHQSTDLSIIDKQLSKNKTVGYIGFDATADSLHVGSLLPLMLLSWFQHYGHIPISLLGGGTTMVGDPSGKEESRKMLELEQINKNKKSIKKVFEKFINFKNKKGILLDNYEWLSKQNYIDFIRKIGTHLTINKMLTFDSVKLRLEREQPLSFLEFNYMILQSYDYLHLNKNYDCKLQMGGSDQWGNIINGVELVRRINNKEVYGLTSPLITLSSGEKMGKSASGAVWLDNSKLNSYDFYQYWRNINDNDVERFLKLFTYLDLEEIKKLSKLKGSEINEAKKILAFEVTKICRSKKEADVAQEMAKNTFEKNSIDKRLKSITIKEGSILLTESLVKLNLAKSKSESKRLIKNGGVRVNDKIASDINMTINKSHLKNNQFVKISCGKKNIGLIKI
tara:strand:- start:12175 stop:13407 length:1233 start_codon:yes stop_codon:yes gene_type:complete